MSRSILESSLGRAAGAITGLWRAALANLARPWIAQIRSEWQVRRGIDALMALDDRMLADIGLTRGAVEYAARYGQLTTRVTNEGCRRISPAAENRPAAARALLMAQGSFAACAIALSEGATEPGRGR